MGSRVTNQMCFKKDNMKNEIRVFLYLVHLNILRHKSHKYHLFAYP